MNNTVYNERPLRKASFEEILRTAANDGYSDLTFQTDERIFGEHSRRMKPLSDRTIGSEEIFSSIEDLFGNNARVEMFRNGAIDRKHDITVGRNSKIRFRVNATVINSHSGAPGAKVCIRTIPETPPHCTDIDLSEEFVDSLYRKSGAIIVSGATGDGKTTTIASINRRWLQTRDGQIMTAEAPIEYTYFKVPNRIGLIAQVEVGQMMKSFPDAVRNNMRQNPRVIVIGEIRDLETTEAAIEACLSGHLTTATTHAISAGDTMRRLVMRFPFEEREARALDLLRNMNVIINQRRLPKKTEGSLVLREIFELNPDRTSNLERMGSEKWGRQIDKWLHEDGQSFSQQIIPHLEDGTIDREDARWGVAA